MNIIIEIYTKEIITTTLGKVIITFEENYYETSWELLWYLKIIIENYIINKLEEIIIRILEEIIIRILGDDTWEFIYLRGK